MRDRTEQPPAALVERLREELPELLAIHRFDGFGTGYVGRPLPAVKLWRMAQELATEVGRDIDPSTSWTWQRPQR